MMNKWKLLKLLWCLLLLVCGNACFKETPVKVTTDFEIEVADHDYSVPVSILVTNKSLGADLYEWTFEGGEPQKSNKLNPDIVVYHTPGKYTIRLDAWNTTERKSKALTIDLDSAIHARFTYEIAINNFSPVEVVLSNLSYGGNRYHWEFSGGSPASFEGKNPPAVLFNEPGLHAVTLQVFNTREVLAFSDSILVFPPLSIDFSWKPGKDDDDMEAPLVVKLEARGTSALSYLWSVNDGKIDNDTLAETTVFFDRPGTYCIELTASNDKEEKRVSKEITVLENSNLYTIPDLKFGITTALNTIGGYYSAAERKVLTTDDLTPENGPAIDLVFWGLAGFEQCCFISPDSVALKALPDIPGASHSWFMNCPAEFNAEQFDQMQNDELLRGIQIKENSDQNLNTYFSGNHVPHCVLFETGDHRKGVVKVRECVSAGKQSYIIADIKVQKNSR